MRSWWCQLAVMLAIPTTCLVAGVSCAPAAPRPSPTAPAPRPALAPAPAPRPPAFTDWEKTSFGEVMMRDDVPAAFDLIVHFHVCKPAEEHYRASGVRAVIACADHGLFAKAYGAAYDDDAQFPKVVEEISALVREKTGQAGAHPARIALVSWSAGYGAVRKVLQQRASGIDTVILLDGLHTAFRHQGRRKTIDGRELEPFVAFAREAAEGRKLMVVTHSEIVPGGYASTTDTANALIEAVAAARTRSETRADTLTATTRADRENFHVRGFAGVTREAHIAQLHLVAMALHDHLAPRWRDKE